MVEQIYEDLTPAIVRRLHGERRDRRKEIEEDIRRVSRERDNLVKAVALGGDIAALVAALREKEERLAALEHEKATVPAVKVARVLDLREQLFGDLETARAAVVELVGEITLEAEPLPEHLKKYEGKRDGREHLEPPTWLVHYVASPTGLEPVLPP